MDWEQEREALDAETYGHFIPRGAPGSMDSEEERPMTWEGRWTPCYPLGKSQYRRSEVRGVELLLIDGQEVRCLIVTFRGLTFAKRLEGNEAWYQLIT